MNQEEKEFILDKSVKEVKKLDWKKEIINWINSFMLAFIIALFLIKFVVFIAIVPTGSMIPTININDRILVWKCFMYLNWETRGLDYGDLVVFKSDEINGFKEEQLLIKRVIGMSGDKIKIESGFVYRNGELLEEPYVKNVSRENMKEITVPNGELFVLGDNRANSNDSRYWIDQTFEINDVVGEVFVY